jgi:hypothetical protein
MKVTDSGHRYVLDSLDGGIQQFLTFVKREGPKYPGNRGSYPGTTSQEVLRALIERSIYVNLQQPCAETEAVTELLKAALYLLEVRAARTHGRPYGHSMLDTMLGTAKCEECGHVGCLGRCR